MPPNILCDICNCRFLYESKMPPSQRRQLRQLYEMAHKYDIEALMTACRLSIMQDLRCHEFVDTAILGYLCKDDELKKATLAMMGRELGPLSELKDWVLLEKYPALSLEIAGQRITREFGDNSGQSVSESSEKYYSRRFPDI